MTAPSQNSFRSLFTKALNLESSGHASEARMIYQNILEQQPNYYQAMTRLALLEYRNNNFDSAIVLLQKAADTYPDDTEILFSLGVCYRATHQLDNSITYFRRVIQSKPDHVQAYLGLAMVHQESGDPESAASTLQQASQLNLLNAESQCNYARLLENIAADNSGTFDNAICAYQSSIVMNPAHPEASGRLGALLEKINRIEEAEQTVLKGLIHTPSSPLLNLVLAKCKYHQKKYAEGISCLSDVNINTCSPRLQAMLNAELGMLHDKSGSYDRAFDYFSNGNLQSKSLWSTSNDESTTYIDDIALLLQQVEQMDFDATPASIKDNFDDPVFLIGFPRSGTTLLDQVLDSHPQIHTTEEIPVFARLLENTGKLGGRYPINIGELSDDEITGFRNTYFNEISNHVEHPPGSLFIDKLPLNICNVLLINKLFPKARYILAIRHPCDVCLSCFMQSFSNTKAMASFYSLDSAVQLYDQVMRLWQLFKGKLDLDFHMIRYEDVVKDLEKEARLLLGFLGMQWDENILYFDRHARERLSIKTPSYRQVRQPIYRTSLYRWKHYRRHFEPLLPLLQPYIDHFGYENEG